MQISYFRNEGYSLIELIIAAVIAAIIAAMGISLFYFFSEMVFTVPEELSRDVIVNRILTTVIEGDDSAKGLRYAATIDTIEDNRIVFTNEDAQSVEFEISDNKLRRSIDGGSSEDIPYYIPEDMTISGESGTLFTYLDSEEAATATAADVSRIIIHINATILGETTALATSIRVKMFE